MTLRLLDSSSNAGSSVRLLGSIVNDEGQFTCPFTDPQLKICESADRKKISAISEDHGKSTLEGLQNSFALGARALRN
jgi:hypothetical protein